LIDINELYEGIKVSLKNAFDFQNINDVIKHRDLLKTMKEALRNINELTEEFIYERYSHVLLQEID